MKNRVLRLTLWSVLSLLALYGLLMGPAFGLADRGRISDTLVVRVYAPVIALKDVPYLGKAFRAYAQLWMLPSSK